MKTMTKRHISSGKLLIPIGTWSVRTSHGILIENTSEDLGWGIFMKTIEDAELLNMDKVMARRRGTGVTALPLLRSGETSTC